MVDLIQLPYGKRALNLKLPAGSYQLLKTKDLKIGKTEKEIVSNALEHPIGGPCLRELSKNARTITIITNDNTRPMPSHITLPALIRSLYNPAKNYNITILIATGMHRKMSRAEMEEQYGTEICSSCNVVNHDAYDKDSLVSLGKLSTGNELLVNKLVVESDLVISEGFIETHFFAGFSGGRKSILPGVSGADTIMNNHNPINIDNINSRSAKLTGNPIHAECSEAARVAGLKFILNVALNKEKHIIGAFAGDFEKAHIMGCDYVRDLMSVPAKRTDIVITTNSGYPLGRNLYQVVKGIDTASSMTKKGGVIIIAAECRDGIGHTNFRELMQSCRTKEELLQKMCAPHKEIDKWQAQILVRALAEKTVILVNDTLEQSELKKMFIMQASNPDSALKHAKVLKGQNASISVIPEGPVVIPLVTDVV